LLAPTLDASNVYNESQGWFIFDGFSGLETCQKLVGIDLKWEVGLPVMPVIRKLI